MATTTAATASATELCLRRDADLGKPFICAGRKCLVTGSEGGEFEVWTYPFKPIERMSISVRLSDGTVIRTSACVSSFETRPGTVTATCSLPGDARLTIELVVPLDEPGAALRLVADGLEGATIQLAVEPSLELMWPASSDAISPVMALEANDHALMGNLVADGPRLFGALTANAPLRRLVGASVRDGVSLDLNGSTPLVIALAGSTKSHGEAKDRASEIVRHVEFHLGKLREHAARIAAGTALETGLEEVDAAFEWAKVGLDRCFIAPPDPGKGFVGGYAPSGGSNLPGPALLGGVAAGWASIAACSVGLGDLTRADLELRARLQARSGDMTGRVPSDISPAQRYCVDGIGHTYGDPDPTPLFIAAVHEAWRWTGDPGIVRRNREAVLRAYTWLTGRLAGGTDASALARIADMGDLLGLSDQERGDVERRLLSAMADPIGLPPGGLAVLFQLGSVPRGLERPALAAAEGLGMVTPWGVRTLPPSDPRYAPSRVGGGATSPVATGWAAVAAFQSGDPELGWELLRANASLVRRWALGCTPEALDGETSLPLGAVHSAAASAMVITPVVKGLFGLSPDAAGDSIDIQPALPESLGWAALRGLAFGGHRVDVELSHRDGIRVSHAGPRRLRVRLRTADRVAEQLVAEEARFFPP